MAFDTLIKGGTVYDGEHAEPKIQDIGIKDGVITAPVSYTHLTLPTILRV